MLLCLWLGCYVTSSSVGRAPGRKPGGRGFDTPLVKHHWIAQLDRAQDYESWCRRFDSCSTIGPQTTKTDCKSVSKYRVRGPACERRGVCGGRTSSDFQTPTAMRPPPWQMVRLLRDDGAVPGSMADIFECPLIRPARCNIRSALAHYAPCHRSPDLFDREQVLCQFRCGTK